MLEVRALKKHYAVDKRTLKALDGVSFQVAPETTFAIVGESGCGKSTLARVLIGLESPTEGQVFLKGKDLASLSKHDRVRKIQMVFQDPYSSINPRHRAWQIISEPLAIQEGMGRSERRNRAIELLAQVGLGEDSAEKFPHMFSGGQRQRIGIARALSLTPEILICDEPVSALDVSIQSQVLNLLMGLQRSKKLTLLFISHDLGVVRHIADQVMVMYLGKTVEKGTRNQVFQSPKHPYTQALLTSAQLGTEVVKLSGDLPSPLNPPHGCALSTRCPKAFDKCRQSTPILAPRAPGEQELACFYNL